MRCNLGDLCHCTSHKNCFRRTVVHHLRKQSNLLTDVKDLLTQLLAQGEQEVVTQQELSDQIDRIEADVDAGNVSLAGVKADIADLKGQLASGGLTAAEEAAVATKISALEAKVQEQADSLSAADAEHPATPTPEEPV